MTTYRIIYSNDDDGIAVVVPAPGIEQTEALKAVPTGKPYLVLDVNDMPTDKTFRDAWAADFTNAPIKE
jgi:hypothetical protein